MTRRFFRIVYPFEDRPRVELEGHDYEVCDLSETGMKIKLGNSPSRSFDALGEVVKGVLSFQDGTRAEVEGKIVRIEREFVAFELKCGLTFGTIMRQQRMLLAKYKDLILPRVD